MRKGFLFFLLVAVVAVAVPAGARAPIIDELPAILIGDNEDTLAGDTSVRVMKYEDIFDLETVVTWPNGLTDDKKHVWYTTDDADGTPLYKASNGTAIVDPLTTAEVADLALGNDPGAGEITDGAGFFSVSLINDAINQTATTPATSIELANAADNGVAVGDYPADSTGATASLRTVTLWAAEVDSLPTDAALISDSASFTVHSLTGEDDNDQLSARIVYQIVFDSPTTTYVPFDYVTDTILSATREVDATTGDLTVVASSTNDTSGEIYYGGWQSSTDGTGAGLDPVVSAENMGGMIYEFAAVVGNDDVATGSACPHFRLGYDSSGGAHQGYSWFVSNTQSGNLLPTTGSGAQTYYTYWTVPADLSSYGDGEAVSTAGNTFAAGQAVLANDADARSYILKFDVIDAPGGNDAGTVYLASIVVKAIPTPTTVADSVSYPSDFAFNDDSGYIALASAQFGFDLGQASVSANSMTLGGQAAGNNNGYAYLVPRATLMAPEAQLAADPNTLMEMTVTATSQVETMTFWRMVIRLKDSAGAAHSLYTIDQFGGNKLKNWSDAAGGPSVMDAPAVPKAAGSTCSTYLFTHTGDVNAFAVAEVDAFQGNPNLSWTNWDDNLIGTMTISQIDVKALSYTP